MKTLATFAIGSLLICGCSSTKPEQEPDPAANMETRAQFSARAWQLVVPYIAPNFNAYFPDDIDGGKKLDLLLESPDLDYLGDEDIMTTIRNGFRHTTKDRISILEWIGNTFISSSSLSAQNADAIDIMYHASGFNDEGNKDAGEIRYAAVYYGLSVARPKTPSILRALAEQCMAVDDPDFLSRVESGTRSQRAEMVRYLGPYLESENGSTRAKAEILEQIFAGELDAFEWAKEDQ